MMDVTCGNFLIINLTKVTKGEAFCTDWQRLVSLRVVPLVLEKILCDINPCIYYPNSTIGRFRAKTGSIVNS